MKKWEMGLIGMVVGAAAWMAVPELLGRYQADQDAAEKVAALADIEEKLRKQEEAQKASIAARKPGIALASLRKSRSEVDEIDWYTTGSLAKNDVFAAYIGDKGVKPWLRVQLSRSSGTKILMLTQVTLASSGARASASGALETSATDGGRMVERIDGPADEDMVRALMSAADAKTGAIKMVGHNGAEERSLTDDELADLRRVIEAYRELGGR